MKIISTELFISAVRQSQYPTDKLPEFLIVGRSNVGKSSFVNTIINRKNFARTSSKPGKTQTLNFYLINKDFYLVDVPGYGYAKVANNVTKQFGKTMDEYISERQTLRGFILLVDYRHKPTKDDVMMYEFVKHHGVPVIVVATKEDKLKRNDLKKNEKLIKDTLHFDPSDTFIRFSSLKKKGIQEAWNAIYELCDLDFE